MFEAIIDSPNIKALVSALGADADLHLVGGIVRDSLLGKEPKDIDLATTLIAQEVCNRLTVAKIPWVPVGIRRGTVMAVFPDGAIEITTFRNPANEKEPSFSILEDLSARDFTINSIAFSINKRELVDPYKGVEDLNGTLKTVRDPIARFTEDPHRLLRMVRFGPGQGRLVDPEVIAAAKQTVSLLKQVSVERVYPEFVKIITSENPTDCLNLMLEVGILEVLFPEVLPCVGFEQNKYHQHDVFQHTCSVMEATPPNKYPRLTAFFHDIGKPKSLSVKEDGGRQFLGHEDVGATLCQEILLRLKAPSEDVKAVTKLVALHMKDVRMGKPKIRKLKAELGDLFEDWIFVKRADLLGGGRNLDLTLLMKEWDDFIEKVVTLKTEPPIHDLAHLALNGNDILALGVKPGPIVGKILKDLHDRVMEDPSLNDAALLYPIAAELVKSLN